MVASAHPLVDVGQLGCIGIIGLLILFESGFLCIEDLFLYLISSTRVSIMKLEVIHVNRSRISLLITEILVVGVNSGDCVQDLYNSGDNVERKDHEILAHSFSWASSISMG
jgi:hypothetical protein